MAYATAAQLKTYLGISSSSDDTFLGDIIARAQSLIEATTRRNFQAPTASTRYFDPETDAEGLTLYLDEDLCAVTSITNGDGSTIASGNYVFEPRNAKPYYGITIKRSKNLSWSYTDDPENAIAIVGRWGYSTSPPADIVQATIRMSAFLYRQKESNADLDRPIQLPDGGVVMPSGLPRDVMSILNKYTRVGA